MLIFDCEYLLRFIAGEISTDLKNTASVSHHQFKFSNLRHRSEKPSVICM